MGGTNGPGKASLLQKRVYKVDKELDSGRAKTDKLSSVAGAAHDWLDDDDNEVMF